MAKKQNPGTEMDKVPSPGVALVVPAMWYRDIDARGVATTYDLTTQEGRHGVLAARTGDCQGAEDWINKTIEVSHVVMHPVAMTNQETGETTAEVRTILIGPDQGAIAFVSRGIVQFFELFSQFGIPGPWNPPLRLLLKRKQLSGGRSTYTLSEVS